MTSDYRKEYDPLFEVIKENAPATGTAVTAEVVASGIVRSGEDRVEVLLFVNQPTTNKQQKDPVVFKNQVRVTMQLVGDDVADRRHADVAGREIACRSPAGSRRGANARSLDLAGRSVHHRRQRTADSG